METHRIAIRLLWVWGVLAAGTPLYAGPAYSFYDISPAPLGASIGEAQLAMEVLPASAGQVEFLFTNTGLQQCSIIGVYFDDGALLTLSSILNGPGVAFSQPATPGNLPDFNKVTPDFDTTDEFSADADTPASENNSVEPGEWLGIVFSLQTGSDYTDVLANLTSGDLRVGLRLDSFPPTFGGAQSFVNRPNPIPVPGAAGLCLLGAALVGRRRRRWT